MLFQTTKSRLSFKQWLLKDKENKRMVCFSLEVMIISFTWIKFIYPYSNFMPPDSYNYLEAAYTNESINKAPLIIRY